MQNQIQFKFDDTERSYALFQNQYEHSTVSTGAGVKRKALLAAKEKCVESISYGSKPTKIIRQVREEASKVGVKDFVAPDLSQIQNLKKRLVQEAKKETGLSTVAEFTSYFQSLTIRDQAHYDSLADDDLIVLAHQIILNDKPVFSFSCKGFDH